MRDVKKELLETLQKYLLKNVYNIERIPVPVDMDAGFRYYMVGPIVFRTSPFYARNPTLNVIFWKGERDFNFDLSEKEVEVLGEWWDVTLKDEVRELGRERRRVYLEKDLSEMKDAGI